MATIRRIRGSFISDYVKPRIAARTIEQLIPSGQSLQPSNPSARREQDRRCGRDRRQQKQDVLLDLRSPHARRKQSRRTWEDDTSLKGIDTYA